MFETINKNRDYVKKLQEEVGATVDGIFGFRTLKACEDYYNSSVIIHDGKVHPVGHRDYVVDHKHSLYQLPDGTRNWRDRKFPLESLCVHWGGLNVKHCFMTFWNSNGRHVSSHFGIGWDPVEKRMEVNQWLDTALVSYHGGKFNNHSIGIDICQHPEVKWEKKSVQWYDTERMTNDSGRGPDECMTIDPELADIASQFIEDLLSIHNLLHKPVCKDVKVYSVEEAKKFSVVGHHNISAKKWDVAPWAPELYHHLAGEDDMEDELV